MSNRGPLMNLTPCERSAANAARDQWYSVTVCVSFLLIIWACSYLDARFPDALSGPTREIIWPITTALTGLTCHFLGCAVGLIASKDLVRKMRRSR